MEAQVESGKKALDSIGNLFRNAWLLYKRYFWTALGIVIIPLTIGKISQIYFGPLSSHSLGLWQLTFTGIVDGFGTVALLFSFSHNTGFRESYSKAFKIFWPYLWVAVLVNIAIAGGFVMLVIPGIMLLVWIAFSLPVFVIENKRGLSTIAQSGEYVEEYWWAILGRALLYLVPVIIIDLLLTHFFSITSSEIYTGIVALFVSPFSTALIYEVYKNLTVLKSELSAKEPTKHFGFLKACVIVGIIIIVLVTTIRILNRPSSNDAYFMSQWPVVSADLRKAGAEFQSGAIALVNNEPTSTFIDDVQEAQTTLQDAQSKLDDATHGPLSPSVANFKAITSQMIAADLDVASGLMSNIENGNYNYSESDYKADFAIMQNDQAQAAKFFLKWQLLNL